MQGETLSPICPLCRRSANGDGAPTRLCRDCRAMLAPIMSRAGGVQTDYAVALPNATARQAIAVAPAVAEADFDDVVFAPATAQGEVIAPLSEPFDEDFGGDFDTPLVAGETAEASHTTPVPDAAPFATEVFIAPEQYEEGDSVVKADHFVGERMTAPLGPPPAPADDIFELDLPDAEPAVGQPAEPPAPAIESHAALVEAHTEQITTAGPIGDASAAAETVAPADPWDDPLPADEYSHREWPMLARDERPSLISRLKWPLVALLVLAVAAAAYFLFIKPRGNAPRAGVQEPLTVPVAPLPAPPAQTPPAQTPPATSSASAGAQPETSPAPAGQAIDSQLKHTLQVMASKDEGEATSMVARLKSAGLPAYVVRADLGSRGVWYRVRIGGFATQEEAQRFATEARSRAAAAGVQIKDLPVTAYDKP
ncbi:MAG TPA: SPOR domain-containing protein [Blastocatellia bacterium]|nr:SPOR domain-containing protein [Blastocatellia bacterium]